MANLVLGALQRVVNPRVPVVDRQHERGDPNSMKSWVGYVVAEESADLLQNQFLQSNESKPTASIFSSHDTRLHTARANAHLKGQHAPQERASRAGAELPMLVTSPMVRA